MDTDQIVGALVFLEGNLGRTPTLAEIAEQAGCSDMSARVYLQRAVGEGRIAQRDSKYMSLAIARAFDKQKEATGKG